MKDKIIINCLEGIERTTAPNYRIDMQGPPVKGAPFTRQRIAVQINNDAPDPALKGITRNTQSKGGRGAFTKSKPSVAQFEAEAGLKVDMATTPDLIREAFYQSMIPKTCFPGCQVLVHHVRINKKGEIWVKYNEMYLTMIAKGNKGGSKPSKGKK